MDLRTVIADCEVCDLKAEYNVINPTPKNPKHCYASLFFGQDTITDQRVISAGSGVDNFIFVGNNVSEQLSGLIYDEMSLGGKYANWTVYCPGENLRPVFTGACLVALMAALIESSVLLKSIEMSGERETLLRAWADFTIFISNHKDSSSSRQTVAQFIGLTSQLDAALDDWLEKDQAIAEREVLLMFSREYTENLPQSKMLTSLAKEGEVLLARLNNLEIELEDDSERFDLVTRLAASLKQNLCLIGPPGTGKTYVVQRSLPIPVIQVSLEGSTEPETVIANIAQMPDGKFKAFLAEAAKALKLGMLLAIVQRLREGKMVDIPEEVVETVDSSEEVEEIADTTVLADEVVEAAPEPAGNTAVTVKDILDEFPNLSFTPKCYQGSGTNSISSDLRTIITGIGNSFGNTSKLNIWLNFLDEYADPFDLERWEEILFVYQKLEANGVGTTVVLNIEEIYHAVENRKILDLLINMMAGQKKLPLTKAGVVGGDLYAHNVVVFATGNPLTDAYLPQALESRFCFKEFLGYPDEAEEKRRMQGIIDELQNPQPIAKNLCSTRLADFSEVLPIAPKPLKVLSETVRDIIYEFVVWTRSMFNEGELRNCADPRMSQAWELLTAAFVAEGKTEQEAFSLAVKSTATGLVSINRNGEPDTEGLKNINEKVEAYFLN